MEDLMNNTKFSYLKLVEVTWDFCLADQYSKYQEVQVQIMFSSVANAIQISVTKNPWISL